MYPDLGFFIKQTLGVDIPALSIVKMFGLWMAIAFVLGGYVLSLELQRKERDGVITGIPKTVRVGEPASMLELAFNFLYGFLFGAKLGYIIFSFAAFSVDPAVGLLSLKGNIFTGLLMGGFFAWLKYYEKKREQLDVPKDKTYMVLPSMRTGDLVIAAAISGLIGAKLFAVMEYWDKVLVDPIGTLLSGSGLAFFGGLILAAITVALFGRYLRIPVGHLADAAGLAVITGYGVGRIGCQLSGDGDWGIVSAAMPSWWFLPKWLWSFDYPHNVVNDGVPMPDCVGEYCTHLAQGVYPTPFYETVLCAAIFAFLWSLRKRTKIPGILFCIFLFCNGIERFLIETIRVNDHYNIVGLSLSQAQIIAIGLMLTGVGLGVVLWRSAKSDLASA